MNGCIVLTIHLILETVLLRKSFTCLWTNPLDTSYTWLVNIGYTFYICSFTFFGKRVHWVHHSPVWVNKSAGYTIHLFEWTGPLGTPFINFDRRLFWVHNSPVFVDGSYGYTHHLFWWTGLMGTPVNCFVERVHWVHESPALVNGSIGYIIYLFLWSGLLGTPFTCFKWKGQLGTPFIWVGEHFH